MRSWTFKVLTLSALSALALGHWTPRPNPSADYVNYTTVTGFFLQDEASTVPGTFDYFEHYVDTLNQRSGRNVDYKVLFMGRHGEGYHNVAESYYGTPAWNCYWSLVVPTVKEYFREGISGHTCDRRSTKSYIRKTFPTFEIEKGFSEQDLLFKPHFAEQPVDQDIRTKAVLDDVFGNDSNTWLSITSHSGETASLLRVLKHRVFSLSTGSVIPVLVKAETIKGTAPAGIRNASSFIS
ncbi:putative phosphomutase PMU1 [Glarea lozoyensis 74030]|uniref:Putative phosphomutase PMU1 n=1 Tax=Glarea lozoyensis (strain ATCC 74030 / MF5533) TaxID=1104152 RepID=H0EMQ0_GLAL7|nr:putative phosphomutase PMU1 [Glarea lozoyensis 74030]